MPANTCNDCKREASHPCECTLRRRELRVLGVQNLDLHRMKQERREEEERERVTEVESEGKGEGADGSAIWWMEQKYGR